MAARGITLLAGGVVAGAAIALAFGRGDDRDILGTQRRDVSPGRRRTLRARQRDDSRGQKNKQMTWEVKNGCAQPQTVIVGNFRTASQTGNTTAAP